MTITNRYVTLVRRPMGMPKPEDFKIVESVLQPVQKGEVLLKTLCFSLDPYMRSRMNDINSYVPGFQLGEPLDGHSISRVEESKHPDLKAGDIVLSSIGWQTYAVVKPDIIENLSFGPSNIMKLPKDIKPSLFLGILGMPGFTAFHGLFKIGEPKKGETVVVAAATGPVGSMVGQLAKAKGCHVVGIAGGADKCRFAVETLGFDACIDHKAKSFPKDLAAACPKGIDVYYENVGGPVLAAVLPLLNLHARIPLCGMIYYYNFYSTLLDKQFSIGQLLPRIKAFFRLAMHLDQLPQFLGRLLTKRIKVQGFIVQDSIDKYPDFLKEAAPLVKAGKIKYKEHIVLGLENAPDAFAQLLEGRAFGKTVIELDS